MTDSGHTHCKEEEEEEEREGRRWRRRKEGHRGADIK